MAINHVFKNSYGTYVILKITENKISTKRYSKDFHPFGGSTYSTMFKEDLLRAFKASHGYKGSFK